MFAQKNGVVNIIFSDFDTLINENSEVVITYYNSSDHAENEVNELPKDGYETSNTSFFVRVENEDCYHISEFEVQLINNNLVTNPISITLCELVLPHEVDLTQYSDDISADAVSIEYFESIGDAISENNFILSTTIDSSTTLFAKIYDEGGCYKIEPLDFLIEPSEEILIEQERHCDGEEIILSDGQRVNLTGLYTVESEENCERLIYDFLFYDCITACEPMIPTAISPNGDGVNDDLMVFSPSIDHCLITVKEVSIFNRWGEINYQGNDFSFFDANNLQAGTYLYTVKYERQVFDETAENTKTGTFFIVY